ncbi:glycosyltransferase family 4 protein [Cohnella sp.]|uniref:glycosyltransferase family 4 protein n=1 Tax=Cohnella sp. TaxID=1883426 RepID=UPI003568121B
MKVGIVMPLAELGGGAEFMLLHLLRANKHTKNREYTLFFFENGPLVSEAEALGYTVKVVPSGKLRQISKLFMTVYALFRWIKKEKVDIVLSWMSKAHLYAGPAAWSARIDAIWFQHGAPEKNFMGQCLKYIPARAVLCPSQSAKEIQCQFTPNIPVTVIYPGVDLLENNPMMLPPTEEVRVLLGLPTKSIIVGIVARLQRWKGVHVFVEAAIRVIKDHPDVHFVIVGGSHHSEPEYRTELEEQAIASGIADNIHFVGYQPKVSSWIQSFDILTHCSIGIEPFGMIIVEGLALGKAVIASKAGGPLEIIKDGENGLLVPPDNVAHLSFAILKLIEDRDYYNVLCKAGVKRAKAFSTERLSDNMAEFIESLRIGA